MQGIKLNSSLKTVFKNSFKLHEFQLRMQVHLFLRHDLLSFGPPETLTHILKYIILTTLAYRQVQFSGING